MNKKIVALAVAAAFAIPAAASAQTTLFGQFKYEVGYIDSSSDVAGLESDNSFVHSTRGTRIGIHGSEDLGGGITGIFRFQGGLGQVNQGMSTTSWDMNEENWVGVRGGFGTLQLGRSDTAMKKTGGNHFRYFVDTLAEPSLAPDARGQRAEGIHYTTPNIQGFTGYLTLEPNGIETDTYWAIGAAYQAGPFWVGGAYESSPDTVVLDLPGDPTYSTFAAGLNTEQSNWQLGAKWNFGQGDVGLLYQSMKDGDRDVWLLPVRYNVTSNVALRAAVKYVDDDTAAQGAGDDWTNWGLGASYMFSPRTEAFVNVWVDDARGETLTAGMNGLGSTSEDSTQFGFGVRHSF